jgi:lipid II:glycine glycyltransferase (peptidoglycan interpeptide bridge formation enzyme)
MHKHLVQTKEWSDFKNIYGTISQYSGGAFFTLHKIPFINKYYAYCPKVNPFDINFEELILELKKENVIAINFDSPDIYLDSDNNLKAVKIFEDRGCKPASKKTYPEATVILDISKSPEDLLQGFHSKHRYNLNLAKKKNLEISFEINEKTISDFYYLQKVTSKRQGYLIKDFEYYNVLINTFTKRNKCFLTTCYSEGNPISSWLFITNQEWAYYVYGGSDDNYKNLFPSTLVLWESILNLKKNNIKTLDLFGACYDLSNEKDSYYGFTIFKLRFGGIHKKYIPSYDLVISPFFYNLFNLAQVIRWKILKLLK